MHKFIKLALATVVLLSCFTYVAIDAKEGGMVYTPIDKSNWSGIAFDNNSREEHLNHAKDGPVSYLFDDNDETIFHTNYNGNTATYPLYIFMDLGEVRKFGSFYWKNRESNAVKEYDFYINKTSENLIPATDANGYTEPENFADQWELMVSSDITGYLPQNASKIVDLGKIVSAKQIMIKVRSVHGLTSPCHITCTGFDLYGETYKPINRVLDRSNWEVKTYNKFNLEEYQRNHEVEGNPRYLIDGSNSTWWHTSWDNNGGIKESDSAPYYVIVDLDKNSDATSLFQSFSWANRGHVAGYGANGVVENYKFYYATDDSVTLPLVKSEGALDSKWIDATHLIEGYKTDEDGNTYSVFGYDTTNVNTIYTTKVNLKEKLNASKVMIKILSSKNATSAEHGSGVEFNIYNETFELETPIDLTNGKGSIEVSTFEGCSLSYGGDNRGGLNSVINGRTDDELYLSVQESSGKKPIFITVDLKKVYDIKKVVADVYNGRTYYNVVIVTSETLEGLDNPNERYILFNTDTNNSTGLGEEAPYSIPQSNIITAEASSYVTGRYVRMYMKGSTANSGNHIYELSVYGVLNTDNSVISTDSNSLLEGYYTDDTFVTKCEQTEENAITRYVNENVLGLKVQKKFYEDSNNYAFRFVSSVASLNPEKVGFEIQLNEGNVKDVNSTQVFTVITENGANGTKEPDVRDVFKNNASKYFFTLKLGGIPVDATGTIKIRPYWIPNSSEEKVYGEYKVYDVAELLSIGEEE